MDPVRTSTSSLPWRLAVAAFGVDLTISMVGTFHGLLVDEQASQLREIYSNATFLVTMVAFILMSALLSGLAVLSSRPSGPARPALTAGQAACIAALGTFVLLAIGLLIYCSPAAFGMWFVARLLYRRRA